MPIRNNYWNIVERAYEPNCILLVSNNYYEILRELKGSFVAWPPHLVQLYLNLVKFAFIKLLKNYLINYFKFLSFYMQVLVKELNHQVDAKVAYGKNIWV